MLWLWNYWCYYGNQYKMAVLLVLELYSSRVGEQQRGFTAWMVPATALLSPSHTTICNNLVQFLTIYCTFFGSSWFLEASRFAASKQATTVENCHKFWSCSCLYRVLQWHFERGILPSHKLDVFNFHANSYSQESWTIDICKRREIKENFQPQFLYHWTKS